MESLSKFVISRLALRQKQMTDHPDPDVLTAFAEGRLSSRERTNVLGHLTQCPDCREILTLTSVEERSKRPVVSVWWKWRWTSAVAVACLAAVVIWHSPSVQKNQERPPAAETSPPTEVLKPAGPPSLEPPKAAKKKAAPAVTARRSERKKEKPKPEIPIVIDTSRDTALAPQSAALRALPAPEQAQSLMARANSPLRSKRITAGTVEGSLWRIAESTGGAVQKSADGGKTWETIPVDDSSRLYALSATGGEIWVGGADGSLFHSMDNGSHWTRVIVKDEEKQLMDAITRINAQDEKIVRIRTQSGTTWITLDGGLHWQLE